MALNVAALVIVIKQLLLKKIKTLILKYKRLWSKVLKVSIFINSGYIGYLFFVDIDPSAWPQIYKLKLKFCWKIANFQADSKKNPEQIEFRDKKREILIELIDILDDNEADNYLLNADILAESMEMISKNVYRTFTNKSNKK